MSTLFLVQENEMQNTKNIPLFVFGVIDIIFGFIWLSYTSMYGMLNPFTLLFVWFLPGIVFITLGILSIRQNQKTIKASRIICKVLIAIFIIAFFIMFILLPAQGGLLFIGSIGSAFIIYFIYHFLQLSENNRNAIIKGFALTDIYIAFFLIVLMFTENNASSLLKLTMAFFSTILIITGLLILAKIKFAKLFAVIFNSLSIVGSIALIFYGWESIKVNGRIRGFAGVIGVFFTFISILLITYFSLHLISVLRNKQYFVKKES